MDLLFVLAAIQVGVVLAVVASVAASAIRSRNHPEDDA